MSSPACPSSTQNITSSEPPLMAPRYTPFTIEAGLPTHDSGGLRANMHGFQFQFKLIMLWILRALRSKCVDFEVSTEDQKFGKFDDLYIKETDSKGSTSVQRFIQAKSSASDKDIGFQDLFGAKPMGVKPKSAKNSKIITDLLQSFINVDKSDILQESGDKKFILFTNRKIDFDSKMGELTLGESLTKCVPRDELLDVDCFQFKAPLEKHNILIQEIIAVTQQSQQNIELFLKHFYICIDTKQDKQLENVIKKELMSLFPIREVNKAYNQYYKDITDEWFTQPKGTIVNRMHLEKYFSEMKESMEQKRCFRVLSPTENFHGRTEILEQLKSTLSQKGEKKHKIDAVISGTAGVGKSELVRKFIQQHSESFEHVIWLNAQSKQTLNTAFYDLACYFDIVTQTDDEKKEEQKKQQDSEILIMKVHDYLRSHKCLIIFDNATRETLQSPAYLGDMQNRNHRIILTSQVQGWRCGHEIKLTGLTTDEACNLLEHSLIDGFEQSAAASLAETLSHLPLALQLAISYINERTGQIKKLRSQYYCFSIEEFLKEFNEKSSKFLKHEFEPQNLEHYKKPLTIAWKMSIDHIRSTNRGDVALELLAMMAYIEPDHIELDIFKLMDREKLGRAAILLQNYSLIKIEHGVCSIHRLIQEVVRYELKSESKKRKPRSKGKQRHLFPARWTEKSVLENTCRNICHYPPPSKELNVGVIIAKTQHCMAHVIKLWTYIKPLEDLKSVFFSQDVVNNFLTILDSSWTALFSEQYFQILHEKLIFLFKKAPSFITNDILIACKKIIVYFRLHQKYEEAIEFLDFYLCKPLLSDDRSFNAVHYVEVVSFRAFASHKLGEYTRVLAFWNTFLQNCQQMFHNSSMIYNDALAFKAELLSWQYKFYDAHEVMREVMDSLIRFRLPNNFSGKISIESPNFLTQTFRFDSNNLLYKNNLTLSLSYILKSRSSEEAIRYLEHELEKNLSIFGVRHWVVMCTMMAILQLCFWYNHKVRCIRYSKQFFTSVHQDISSSAVNLEYLSTYIESIKFLNELCIKKTIKNFKLASCSDMISSNTIKLIDECNNIIVKQYGYTVTTLELLSNTALLHYVTGNVERCLVILENVSMQCKNLTEKQMSSENGKQYWKVYNDSQFFKARVLFSEGEVENALQILTELMESADTCQTFFDGVLYEIFKAKILTEVGKSDEAIQNLRSLIDICRDRGLINESFQLKVELCNIYKDLRLETELLERIKEWIENKEPLSSSLNHVILGVCEKTKHWPLSLLIKLYASQISGVYNDNCAANTYSSIMERIRLLDFNSEKWLMENMHSFSISPDSFQLRIDSYDFIRKRLGIAYNLALLRRYEDALNELKSIVKEMSTMVLKHDSQFKQTKNDIERLYKVIVFVRILDHVKTKLKDEHLYNMLCGFV